MTSVAAVCGVVLLMLWVTAQAQDSPAETCPDMSRGRYRRGWYILDDYNNRIFYQCLPGGGMQKMPCPPGTCAFYPKGRKSGGSNKSPCSKHLYSRQCTSGYSKPPPAPLENCWSQAIILNGASVPIPTESVPCTTACIVEFNAIASILVRSCASPIDPVPANGCYGSDADFRYVCDSNFCNVDPLENIVTECDGAWLPLARK